VRKAVHRVYDSYKKVKRYVKRTYKRVKHYAHKVAKKVKQTVRKVAKAVKHVAKKVVKAAKKVGRAVKKAAKATANYVKQHAATIVPIVAGIAAAVACTVLTAGAGAVACAIGAGALINSLSYAMSDGPKTLGGFLGAAAVGAATGIIGGGAGALAGRALAGSAVSAVTRGAVTGAAAGAAENAASYGFSCSNSEEGCSVSGAAKATATGAALGGIFGAAASKFGKKGCTPHSFTGTTPVLLVNATAKPISEVKVGDYVLTAEPGKKKKEKHRVQAVIVTTTDRNYVDVVVATKSGPKTIQTTKHHQFYDVTTKAWTQAGDLKKHHGLQGADGGRTEILDVRSYQAERVTYDLSVEGLHTYHVGAGDDAVLVHNTDICPTGGGSSGQPRSSLGRFAPDPNRVQPGQPHADGMLRGVNEAGHVTSRPSFRTPTVRGMWDDAEVAPGPAGSQGRVCSRQGPNCEGVVLGNPHNNEPREGRWDGGHYPDSWSKRKFSPDVTREEVLDNYNENVQLECVPCNRGAGNRQDG
jgi:hypothetical protein